MQPLDVTCFRPFKLSFRAYKDKWILRHKGKLPLKEDLAQWVSHALKRALSTANVTKGLKSTGIFPIDSTAMDKRMGPSVAFVRVAAKDGHAEDDDNQRPDEPPYQLEQWEIEEIFGETLSQLSMCQ